jgi:thiol-disulfide isomerase/thioredoxin
MKYFFLNICVLFFNSLLAQSIIGNFPKYSNQIIKLEGFNGLKNYMISSVKADDSGSFNLKYSKEDFGVGYLMSIDNKALFIILSGENIEISGETFNDIENLKIKKGNDNLSFEQYAKEQPKREQALNAWIYLEKIYTLDSLFLTQKIPVKTINEEKIRIIDVEKKFIDRLPKNSYIKWFLPIRKLISNTYTIVQNRPEEIPKTINEFRELDYSDPRIYKSGLLKEAIESHFWLLENSDNSLDIVFKEMKISIDEMMKKLVTNEKVFNEVTDYLFDLLEKHSLFQASEYLALKILNEGSCTINTDLANQLETYRAMKKGSIAPDMVFDNSNFINSNKTFNKLSDVNSKYTLVVFGASWCPKCKEELPEIAKLYNKWKSKGVEVVFIALEEDKKSFMDFAKAFPFTSYSDNKKWESKIVKDYYVFSTPTIFLLDYKREIILRPHSVSQTDAWVDWNLK